MVTKKQTAGNNAVLARVKREMNTPIFRHASRIMNEEGPAAVEAYLGQFFNDEYRARCLARLMLGQGVES